MPQEKRMPRELTPEMFGALDGLLGDKVLKAHCTPTYIAMCINKGCKAMWDTHHNSPEPERITLSLEEIKNLAIAAGFEVKSSYDEDELEQEMTISDGVRIKDEESGVVGKPVKAAWFTDLPEEGVMEI